MTSTSTNVSTYDNWNRIYLCTQNKPMVFEFTEFDSFEEADDFFKKNINENKIILSTMIPISRFIPKIFDTSVLKIKLSSLFHIHVQNKK